MKLSEEQKRELEQKIHAICEEWLRNAIDEVALKLHMAEVQREKPQP